MFAFLKMKKTGIEFNIYPKKETAPSVFGCFCFLPHYGTLAKTDTSPWLGIGSRIKAYAVWR